MNLVSVYTHLTLDNKFANWRGFLIAGVLLCDISINQK